MTTRAKHSLIAAGILLLLMAMVAMQWEGPSNDPSNGVQADDDSGDNGDIGNSDDDDSGRYSHLHPAPKGP